MKDRGVIGNVLQRIVYIRLFVYGDIIYGDWL